MSDFTIRISNQKDFERIFEIWLDNQKQAIGKQSEPSTVETLKAEFFSLYTEARRAVFYVAELESGQVIGWQALLPLLSNPLISKYMAHSSTYVDKAFFNKNIGSKLVEYAVTDAKRLGIEHIYGWVKDENIESNRIAEDFAEFKFFIPGSENNNLPNFNMYVIVVK